MRVFLVVVATTLVVIAAGCVAPLAGVACDDGADCASGVCTDGVCGPAGEGEGEAGEGEGEGEGGEGEGEGGEGEGEAGEGEGEAGEGEGEAGEGEGEGEAPALLVLTVSALTGTEDTAFSQSVGRIENEAGGVVDGVINVAVVGGTTGRFAVAPAVNADGELTFTPATDVVFSDVVLEFTGVVGSTPTQTVAVPLTIVPLNDRPLLTTTPITIDEDSALPATPAFTTSPGGGPDEAGQTVTVSIDSVVDPSRVFASAPTIGANGTIVAPLAPDANGQATLLLRANDGVDVSEQTPLVITVRPVDDDPRIVEPPFFATLGGEARVSTLLAVDVDDGSIVEVVDGSADIGDFSAEGDGWDFFSDPVDATETGTATVTLVDANGDEFTDVVPVFVFPPQLSCMHIRAHRAMRADGAAGSGVYRLRQPDNTPGCTNNAGCAYNAHCDFDDVDGGGWTLILKAVADDDEWDANDPLWTNSITFREGDDRAAESLVVGASDGSGGESKLRSFMSVPVEELRVGFAPLQTDALFSFTLPPLVVPRHASSLALFSGPPLFTSTPSPQEWVLADPSFGLQGNCNRSGINVDADFSFVLHPVTRVRIGILGNNEGDCASTDSFIGVGSNVFNNVVGARDANGNAINRNAAVLVRATGLPDVGRFADCAAVRAAGFDDPGAVFDVNGVATQCP
jgi:hypothetical protein